MSINSLDESLKLRLGTDAKFPISDGFSSIEGLDVLLQDIQTILLTLPGERVGRPEFGCGLRTLIWENIDEASISGRALIKDALDTWEPRIIVTDVSSTINRNSELINFVIRFTIINTDVSASLVFPFRSSQEIASQ